MFTRSVYIKLFKLSIFTAFYCSLAYFYLYLARLTKSDLALINKAEKVIAAVADSEKNINKAEKVIAAIEDNKQADENNRNIIKDALNEVPFKDEFKGIESNIHAFDKKLDPLEHLDEPNSKNESESENKNLDMADDSKKEENDWVEE